MPWFSQLPVVVGNASNVARAAAAAVVATNDEDGVAGELL